MLHRHARFVKPNGRMDHAKRQRERNRHSYSLSGLSWLQDETLSARRGRNRPGCFVVNDLPKVEALRRVFPERYRDQAARMPAAGGR